MSEKRFERWNDHSCKIKDNQENTFLNWEDVVDLLNKQQATINKLEQENEQLRQFINKGRRLSVKELMANTNENELLKKEIKELKEKLDDILELTEFVGMTSLRKAEIKSIVNR